MGCDIHMIVEVRDPATGPWRMVGSSDRRDPSRQCICEQPDPAACRYAQKGNWKHSPGWVWHSRDYRLFGLLAGVRGDGPPIVEPRGAPPDLSPEAAALVEEGFWEHSHSWMTAAELFAYPWDAPRERSGLVVPEDARRVLAGEAPEMWFQTFHGGAVVPLEACAADHSKDGRPYYDQTVVALAHWETPPVAEHGPGWARFLRELRARAPGARLRPATRFALLDVHPPDLTRPPPGAPGEPSLDRVRIAFGFDS